MARFRRGTRRRYGRKRKRSVSTRAVAYRSLRKVSTLQRRLKPELKFHDVSISDIMSPGGIVHSLLGDISRVIPQGTSRTDRIGSKVRLKSMFMNFELTWKDDTYIADQVSVRLTLVAAPTNNGYSTPGYTSIFNDASVTGLRNITNYHQFKVLWDRTYELADLSRVRTRRMRIPINRVLVYGPTDAIEANAIYLLTTYDGHTIEDPPTITPPVMGIKIRFTFTDV